MLRNYRIEIYRINTEEVEEMYIAHFPALKGFCGGGKTPHEALQVLFEESTYWLVAMREEGFPLPPEDIDMCL